MERAEWLNQMRNKAEALYDRLSPEYWVTFGLAENETHRGYLQKFLDRMPPHSALLSAACGAGRYDGMLLDLGHSVVGIDQSDGMLRRAREHFPKAQYKKMGLQEMGFQEEFDGIICMDAMEHVCPEDWPGILQRFREALKPDGILYFTVDMPQPDEVEQSYRRAKALGLPAVFGEVADRVDEAYEQASRLPAVPGELADMAVYHYHPSPEQVQAWLEQSGLQIEEQGTGSGYKHIVARKKDVMEI